MFFIARRNCHLSYQFFHEFLVLYAPKGGMTYVRHHLRELAPAGDVAVAGGRSAFTERGDGWLGETPGGARPPAVGLLFAPGGRSPGPVEGRAVPALGFPPGGWMRVLPSRARWCAG